MSLTNLCIGYQAMCAGDVQLIERGQARKLIDSIDSSKNRSSVLMASDEFHVVTSIQDFDGSTVDLDFEITAQDAMYRICHDTDEILDWYLALVIHDDLDLGKPDKEMVQYRYGQFRALGDAAKQVQSWLVSRDNHNR